MQRPVSIAKRHFSRCLGFGRVLTLAGVIVLTANPAPAEIFRYVDVDGVIHYTDDIEKVPERYKDGVQKQKSVRRSTPTDEDNTRAQPTVITSSPKSSADFKQGEADDPRAGDVSDGGDEVASGEESPPSSGAGQEEATGDAPPPSDEAAVEKHNLEKERQKLLERKEVLANDQTYQRRKIKRRYKNRPQVQELIEEEAGIDARLEEIEKALR